MGFKGFASFASVVLRGRRPNILFYLENIRSKDIMPFRYPPEVGLRSLTRFYRSSARLCDASSHQSYKAAVCTEFGKPLQFVDRDRVKLEDHQVRVGVKRAAINFSDILTVQGKYQEKFDLPFFPGSEIMGEVLQVGSKVQQLKPGDLVISLKQGGGGFAEEIVSAEMEFHLIGRNQLHLDEAAALLVSYGTAQLALERTAQIKETDTILVTAAAGALGLAAVDLAANVYKAIVIGACGGAEKCQVASKYGAQHTIDYTKENLRQRIKEITKGKGVDIVFDVVGGEALEDGVKCLAYEGKLLTLGYASGKIPKIPANILLLKNASVRGVYWGSYSHKMPEAFFHSVAAVLKLWKEGKIKPFVTKVYPLSQINEAFEYVASRQSVGKVVLDCTKT